MRFYSYLYHGLLALFLFAISLLALISDARTLHLDMLPWKGTTLTYIVFFAALFGLAAVLLAFKGIARVLFLVWSVVVVLFMVKGYVFSAYYFEAGEFRTAMMLTAGAIIALAGAWFQFRGQGASKSQKVFSKAY
jgi:hypothetical protein